MKKTNLLIVAVLTTLVAGSVGAQTNENWNEVNLSVVDSQVLPQYAEFARTTVQLSSSASAFCSASNESSLQAFQAAYHDSMDAWESIQHIQFGPITYFNWNFRLQYWPDEKGTGAKQLDALIAAENESALDLNSFARQSVGIQGFPALEKLLFAEDSLEALQANAFRCQVSETIANNLNEIASGVHSRWVDEFRTTIANADDSDAFESAEDATIDLLKALVETVPKIIDQKLASVLGENFERSRIRRGESWRSEKSLRNIKINIASLAELFNAAEDNRPAMSSVLMADDVALINSTFESLISSLSALPDSLSPVLQNEAGYASLVSIKTLLEELDEQMETALKNTDLYLGFNSLDGD